MIFSFKKMKGSKPPHSTTSSRQRPPQHRPPPWAHHRCRCRRHGPLANVAVAVSGLSLPSFFFFLDTHHPWTFLSSSQRQSFPAPDDPLFSLHTANRRLPTSSRRPRLGRFHDDNRGKPLELRHVSHPGQAALHSLLTLHDGDGIGACDWEVAIDGTLLDLFKRGEERQTLSLLSLLWYMLLQKWKRWR